MPHRSPIYPPCHVTIWTGPSPTQMWQASPKYSVRCTSDVQVSHAGEPSSPLHVKPLAVTLPLMHCKSTHPLPSQLFPVVRSAPCGFVMIKMYGRRQMQVEGECTH